MGECEAGLSLAHDRQSSKPGGANFAIHTVSPRLVEAIAPHNGLNALEELAKGSAASGVGSLAAERTPSPPAGGKLGDS